jgi:hypothetical protein
MADNLLNVTMLLATVEGLLADAVLGGAIGSVGAALRAILPESGSCGSRPVGRPGHQGTPAVVGP